MSPEKLREVTFAAIKRGEEKAEQARLAEAERIAAYRAEAELWALSQMTKVPLIAEAAAEAGQLRCEVANTRGGYRVRDKDAWTNDGLKYKLLCDKLEEARLTVIISDEHDGAGVQSWYSISISWAEPALQP